MNEILQSKRTLEIVNVDMSVRGTESSHKSGSKKFKERPFLAAIFCFTSAVFFTIGFMVSKITLGMFPSVTPFSLLFIRAAVSSLFMIP